MGRHALLRTGEAGCYQRLVDVAPRIRGTGHDGASGGDLQIRIGGLEDGGCRRTGAAGDSDKP